MTFKISEVRLASALLFCVIGIILVINNAVSFSSKLISEKMLVAELSGCALLILGIVTFCKAIKKS